MSDADSLVEETPGWHDLKRWLSEEPTPGEPKHTANRLATLLGISQPAVRSWEKRINRPQQGALREALCRVIGSSPDRWVTEKDRVEAAKYDAVAPAHEECTGDVR